MRIGLEFLLGGLIGNITQQAWHEIVFQRIQHAGINRFFPYKERPPKGVVDPIIQGPSQAKTFPRDVLGSLVCPP
jgi:hypothetical protein